MFFSTAGVWQVIERMARGCLFQALVQKMMNEALDATWTGIFLEILKPVTEGVPPFESCVYRMLKSSCGSR